jgi:hypothetical protein
MKKETKKSNWRVPVTLLVSIKGRPLEITSAGRPYLFEIYYKGSTVRRKSQRNWASS